MKNRTILLTFLFLSYITVFSQNKKICVTIDDLPTITYNINTVQLDFSITDKLIKTFNEHNIPAIGYVCGNKLYHKGKLDTNKVNVLVKWLENGYDIGNHTYSHFDYNTVADSIFFKDILKGAKVIKPLMIQYDKILQFFRHPYLHTGADSSSSKKLMNFLENNDYNVAPVTIDNDDYLFAKAYHNAFKNGKNDLMKQIGKEYVKYMELMLLYFESKSKEVFNKYIPQTLLIHASLLNADYLDQLAIMYQKHGYTFISQEEVLKTPEYSTSINTYTKRGISWIFRWGKSLGKDDLLMEGDVETPQRIIQLAKE